MFFQSPTRQCAGLLSAQYLPLKTTISKKATMHNNSNGHYHAGNSHLRPCPVFPGDPTSHPTNYLRLSPFFISDHPGVYNSLPFPSKNSVGPPCGPYGGNPASLAGSSDQTPYSPTYHQLASPFSPIEPSYPVYMNSLGPAVVPQRNSVPLWSRAPPGSPAPCYRYISPFSAARFATPPESQPTQPATREATPELPVFVESRELEGSSPLTAYKRATTSHRKGRQRSSGPLSSHAVYARLNRERRKKYLADLETYRNTMRKKQATAREVLRKIKEESQALTQEIESLRQDLQKNSTLMNLLAGACAPNVQVMDTDGE